MQRIPLHLLNLGGDSTLEMAAVATDRSRLSGRHSERPSTNLPINLLPKPEPGGDKLLRHKQPSLAEGGEALPARREGTSPKQVADSRHSGLTVHELHRLNEASHPRYWCKPRAPPQATATHASR